MDYITKSLVSKFINSNGLSDVQDATRQFEYFANYCIVSHHYARPFNYDDVSTGRNAPGIDGIAIIVNDDLITNIEDMKAIVESGRPMSVRFIMISDKTSAKFKGDFIGNVLSNVKMFFNMEYSDAVCNTPEMKTFQEITRCIYDNTDKFRDNPELWMYLATVGEWNDGNVNPTNRAEMSRKELESTGMFSKVQFIPLGERDIQSYYRQSISKLEKKIDFPKKVLMYSDEDNGEFGYIGVLSFKEYRKLIMDENGVPLPVFEDNIRDYLGAENSVNSDIAASIDSGDPYAFCKKNNGITIVASSIGTTADTFTLRDYQIVNGCQTSNTLIDHKDDPKVNDLWIPVRLIATAKEDAKNDITRATNNQTAIKKEQLDALSTFQKNLEEYYSSRSEGDAKLYYERRTGQYRGKYKPNQIVTIPEQIRAFAAMYKRLPHNVSGRYGTVVKNMQEKTSGIFAPDDSLIAYYTSGVALHTVDNLITARKIDRNKRKSRYEAIMLFRVMFCGFTVSTQGKQFDDYGEKLISILNDQVLSESIFRIITDYIANCPGIDIEDRKCFERKDTTDLLLNAENLPKLYEALSDDETVSNGRTVKSYLAERSAAIPYDRPAKKSK